MRHYTSMSLVPLEGGFQAAPRLSAIVSKVGTHPQQPMDVRPPPLVRPERSTRAREQQSAGKMSNILWRACRRGFYVSGV